MFASLPFWFSNLQLLLNIPLSRAAAGRNETLTFSTLKTSETNAKDFENKAVPAFQCFRHQTCYTIANELTISYA
ncbi:hypothetical protein BaRGS_00025799 [Batillaria attramentaria]|uniref:Secreted protein n=1 Tax=Batillaria attramentaria TaxID=370345 RepID=A0ABD0K6R9_9CAEN